MGNLGVECWYLLQNDFPFPTAIKSLVGGKTMEVEKNPFLIHFYDIKSI